MSHNNIIAKSNNENKVAMQSKQHEKKISISRIGIDLYDDKEFNEKLFEISDFIPGRISEISNDIETMNLEGVKKDLVIKRDFNNNQNFQEETIKKKNNRLTIEIIAKDIGLINDDIDYSILNKIDFKNNECFKKMNYDLTNNPFLAQITEFNNEIAKHSKKKESKIKMEDPKKLERNNNAFSNKINNNPYFNRITQLGPFSKLDVKESSDEISFSIEDLNDRNNQKANFNLTNIKPNGNQTNSNHMVFQNKEAAGNIQKGNNMQNKNNDNDLKSNGYLNPPSNHNIITAPVPILKNPFNNMTKENDMINSNQVNLCNYYNHFNEPQANKDKSKKQAVILPNKIFETMNKNNPNKDLLPEENDHFKANHHNLSNEILNKFALEKNMGQKKVTIGLNDVLNINNLPNSSENETSNCNSEKKASKYEKKRRSIKRVTLNFLKHKDLTQISFSSDDEKSNSKGKQTQKQDEKLNKQTDNLIDPNAYINKEEDRSAENKMDICEENKLSPKTLKNLNNNLPLSNEEIEDINAINEAEEILKNLEKNVYNNYNKNMSLFDQNKNNFSSKNINSFANYNPFLSAVKIKKNNLKENELKAEEIYLNTPNTPFKKDDYLLATPGKYLISNNSSKIKEKDFSKFTGYKAELNFPSNKTLKLGEEIKEKMNQINNTNNNSNANGINPFLIVNSNNNQKPKSSNLLDFKENKLQDYSNNRVTINRLVDFNVEEENEDSESLFSFDDNKNSQNKNQITNNNIINNEKQVDLNDINKKVTEVRNPLYNNLNLEKPEANHFTEQAKSNEIDINNKIKEEEDNKGIENISFSKITNDSAIDFNLIEEIEKENADIGLIAKKIRDRNNKLFEYLKEIFKSRFTKMKNSEKALRDKEEHLTTLRNQIENYKKEITNYEKEMQLIDTNKAFFESFQEYYRFFSRNFLNTKLLGVEFNSFKLIFANTVNISFVFEALTHKMLFLGSNSDSIKNFFKVRFNSYNNKSELMSFEAIKLNEAQKTLSNKTKVMLKDIHFFFISNFMDELKLKDKLVEDPELNRVFRRMFTHILNMIFTNKNKKFYPMTLLEFMENYKVFIDAGTNIVLFMKQFYLWDSIFNNISLSFDEGKELINMLFTINCAGYFLTLIFTCDITDALFGYDFTHYEIVRDHISDSDLATEKSRIDKICENIKSFLENKHKLFNPYFFVNFIQNVKKKIVEFHPSSARK